MNGPLPGPNYLNTTDKYSVRDYTDVNKGCGLIAERDILKNELIFTDTPFVRSSYKSNRLSAYCYQCGLNITTNSSCECLGGCDHDLEKTGILDMIARVMNPQSTTYIQMDNAPSHGANAKEA